MNHRANPRIQCDAISRNFDVKRVSSLSSPPPGAEGLVVFAKGSDKAIFSFVPPSAGMFIWARFYDMNSSQFLKIQSACLSEDPEQEFADQVWAELARALVLLTPVCVEPIQLRDIWY